MKVLVLQRETTVTPDSKTTVEKRGCGNLMPDGTFQLKWIIEKSTVEPIPKAEPDMSDVIRMVNGRKGKSRFARNRTA